MTAAEWAELLVMDDDGYPEPVVRLVRATVEDDR